MAMEGLDEQLRLAAAVDPRLVEKVVAAALAVDEGRASSAQRAWDGLRHRGWAPAFVVPAACLAIAAGLGVWWCARAPAPTVPETALEPVIGVRLNDGSAWILSTKPDDDWPPPGMVMVIGGAEAR